MHSQSTYALTRYTDYSGIAFDACSDLLSAHNFSVEEVTSMVKVLDSNNGGGPDRRAPFYLSNWVYRFGYTISFAVPKFFDSSSFLNVLKLSTVFPVFKSDDKNNIDNYRGISLISIATKVFESIITD